MFFKLTYEFNLFHHFLLFFSYFIITGTFYEEYNGGRRKMDFVEYLKKKIVSGQKDEL